MNYKGAIVCLVVLMAFTIGCSSSKNKDPVSPGGNINPVQDSPDTGHEIIMAGTIKYDSQTGEITNTTERISDMHVNLTDFLTGYFRIYLEELNPPLITFRLELENPTILPMYDVRIIYTGLEYVEILNPDGFTNYFDPPGDPEYNPFIYFAKEYPYQKFPAGPGGIDDEILLIKWDPSGMLEMTYLLEASLFENAQEPYRIHNFKKKGTITPQGGGIAFSCTVEDWQDDLESVTLLGNDIFGSDLPMYRYRNSNIYVGNLLNFYSLSPGRYTNWIKADSPNLDGISLWMPCSLNVPDTLDDAPQFGDFPWSVPEISSEGLTVDFYCDVEDPEQDDVEYFWEQISPKSPRGDFYGVSNRKPIANWRTPKVYYEKEFLIMVSASEKNGSQKSCAVVPITIRPAEPPFILEGPTFVPDPIFEGEWGNFSVYAVDPDNPGGTSLSYIWEQLSPTTPVGIWYTSNEYNRRYAKWQAPQIGSYSIYTFKLTVSKHVTFPPMEIESEVDFIVESLD